MPIYCNPNHSVEAFSEFSIKSKRIVDTSTSGTDKKLEKNPAFLSSLRSFGDVDGNCLWPTLIAFADPFGWSSVGIFWMHNTFMSSWFNSHLIGPERKKYCYDFLFAKIWMNLASFSCFCNILATVAFVTKVLWMPMDSISWWHLEVGDWKTIYRAGAWFFYRWFKTQSGTSEDE